MSIASRKRFLGAPIGALLCGLFAAASGSAAYVELEPNDSLGTAQVILHTDPVVMIDGSRTFNNPSDDFYSVFVRKGGMLSIKASSPDGAADSIMGLFDPLGNLVASNDDGPGNGTMSTIDYLIDGLAMGWYSVGLSGFNPGLLACVPGVTACYDSNGDFLFDTFVAGGGAGGSTGWDYQLTLSGPGLVSVPNPTALVGLALALLAAGRYRQARQRNTGAGTAPWGHPVQ